MCARSLVVQSSASGLAPVSYTLGEELGAGGFGTVYACTKDNSGERLAVKVIDTANIPKGSPDEKRVQREIKIMQQVPAHPNIIRFVDIAWNGTWLYLVMELMDGGDLSNAMATRLKKSFLEAEALYIFRQLVAGLEVLHTQGVIHRDLKLSNILVARSSEDGTNLLLDVKIADFGLSRLVSPGLSQASSLVGTPGYWAPEVLKGKHSKQADLWSLGILLSALLSGRLPHNRVPWVPQDVLDEAVKLNLPAGDDALSVVHRLLQKDPAKRITIDKLKQHAWLKQTSLPSSSAEVNGMAVDDRPLKQRRSTNSLTEHSPWTTLSADRPIWTREDDKMVNSKIAKVDAVMRGWNSQLRHGRKRLACS